MTVYVFPAVKYPAEKYLPCPKCGKKIRRRMTFEQTLNPFNKNADGLPKSRREIIAELANRASEWRLMPELCGYCKS